jgi:hypothetical protein
MTGYPKGATRALGWVLTLAVLIGAVPVAVAEVADHLIISEIVIMTRDPFDRFGSPYIQVVNPTDSDVDMGQVYITDATTSPSAYYYNITLGDPAAYNPGGGNGGDFHARFPDGYVLAAGDSLAISINGSAEYQAAFGRLPDFELYEDSSIPDTVPEMLEVFPGSINAGPLSGTNVPVLSDIAESLVLYNWDGTNDLVQDLDYVMWGTNTGVRFDKRGIIIGTGSYEDDTLVFSQEPVANAGPAFGHSFRRYGDDEGNETTSGGNGIGGDDETSENMAGTWQDVNIVTQGFGVPAAPGSWHPAPPIFVEVDVSPATPYEGREALLMAKVVSNSTIDEVIFHYTLDGGQELTLTGVNNGEDDFYTATLPAQVEGTVVVWYCTSSNADGGTSVYPSAAPSYTGGWTTAGPGLGAEKLLITEISVDPDELEFVEIYNPNSYTVTLSDYYLTDSIHYSDFGSQLYWQIAAGTPTQDSVGGGNYNDFTARFPDGYGIEAGQTIVISIQGSDGFQAFFGFLPDLELYEDGQEADEVPDFRPVFINPGDDVAGNSIYTANREAGSDGRPRGIPELEEYFGEPVILYHYAQGDDFVTDIDFVMWRHTVGSLYPTTFDKSGIPIGNHTYLPETSVDDQVSPPQQVSTGQSYTRLTSDQQFQPSSGSNGVNGRDEVGEDLRTTIQVLNFSPGIYDELTIDTSLNVKLLVESKTFIPTMGEVFHIDFVSDLEYETKVRVFDLEGRVVNTLYDSRRDGQAGFLNGVDWDGRDGVYERVRAGLYVLHLQAVHPVTGDIYTTTAPVVVATRLSR